MPSPAHSFPFTCEKRPATGALGVVVTNAPLGSAAGNEMLAAGGNAIDAAIAVQFACHTGRERRHNEVDDSRMHIGSGHDDESHQKCRLRISTQNVTSRNSPYETNAHHNIHIATFLAPT